MSTNMKCPKAKFTLSKKHKFVPIKKVFRYVVATPDLYDPSDQPSCDQCALPTAT